MRTDVQEIVGFSHLHEVAMVASCVVQQRGQKCQKKTEFWDKYISISLLLSLFQISGKLPSLPSLSSNVFLPTHFSNQVARLSFHLADPRKQDLGGIDTHRHCFAARYIAPKNHTFLMPKTTPIYDVFGTSKELPPHTPILTSFANNN